jgi:hypothetical protein
MPHELVERFRENGLRLRKALEDMLDELPAHRTDRRGCGYTQATRFLATYINQPGASDDPADLDVFEDWPQRDSGFVAATLRGAGWSAGWRRVDQAPVALRAAGAQHAHALEALAGLRNRVHAARAALDCEESRLFVDLLDQLLARDACMRDRLPPMPVKPAIGSCSQAEEFFLELAHGRVRRGGSVNVFVDDAGEPRLIEKMNLGESHSAVVLEPVELNGVTLPPGSLCALSHADEAHGRMTSNGRRLPLAAIAQARFLRLTTLAVEPSIRARAFSAQLEAQVRGRMLSPASTTLAELRGFARREALAAL